MDELCRDTIKFQSTLSMRRATWRILACPYGQRLISIHALHEESDQGGAHNVNKQRFQSTLSMRRATPYCISLLDVQDYFNPRSP